MPRLTDFTCSLGHISNTDQCGKAARPLSPRAHSRSPWGPTGVNVPTPPNTAEQHFQGLSGARDREGADGQLWRLPLPCHSLKWLDLKYPNPGTSNRIEALQLCQPPARQASAMVDRTIPPHWMTSLLPWSPGRVGEVCSQAL